MQPNVIYCCRSSERGDDFSIDTQRDACKKYADDHKLGECEVISEHYTGTVHLRDRGAGAQVWTMIESGQAGNLIVYSADRLSRAPLRHALTLIDEILEHKTRLHFVDAGEITSSDEIGTIIKSWQSAQERAKIVERLMRGKRGKAKSGKWVGSGPVLYGFTRVGRLDKARLEHNEDEIAIIMCLLEKSLGNPALIGRFDYGSQSVELPDLAIIDRAMWNAIQDRMQANRENAKRNRQHDYLLAHRLRCSCGRSMTAQPQTRRGRHHAYYTCGQIQDHRSVRTCPVHRLPVARVDTAVWQWVLKHISDEFLNDGIRELSEYEQAQAIDPKRPAAIDAEIKRLQSHIRALLSQAKETDRPAVVDARNTHLDEDGDRIEALMNERADLAARIRGLRVKLDNATPAQQVQALDVIALRAKLVSRSELSKCIKLLISSEIAPPDELTL